MIKEPSDIFKLDYERIRNLEGWGKLSIENLKKAILKSKTISLERFIYSIGVRHIGQENAKILASFFITKDSFSKLFDHKKIKSILKNLVELDGIGQTQIDAIQNFFSNKANINITKDLINQLNISDYILKTTSKHYFFI